MIIKKYSDIINKRSVPGVIIIDNNNTVLTANQEAFKIFSDSDVETGSSDEPLDFELPNNVTKLCDQLKSEVSNTSSMDKKAEIIDCAGGKPYSVTAFYLNPATEKHSPSIVVLMEKVVERHEADFAGAKRLYNLSKRELEVVRGIYRGLSNREIAAEMFISEYTVKDHLKNIMKRMGLKSRSQIVAALR